MVVYCHEVKYPVGIRHTLNAHRTPLKELNDTFNLGLVFTEYSKYAIKERGILKDFYPQNNDIAGFWILFSAFFVT